MPDKGTKASKALKKDNQRISTLVWKLHREIESAKEQDISFTKVDVVSKLATDSFKLFIKHGILDENAHPKTRSPRPHSASPDRRQNVHTTPGSAESAGKRSKSATRSKGVRPTPFCDDIKKRLNYDDDETHDCIERNPRKLREFEEKYKETNLENIRLGQELDRLKKCIAELEYQNKYLTYQADLVEKENSDASRKDDMRCKQLESEVNRYKAEINDLLHRDSNNNHRVHANRYKSERNLAHYEIKELRKELEKWEDNSLQSDLECLKKILRRTEGELKRVKGENTALRHANENKTKLIEEIQNRAEEEIKDANDAIVYYKEEQQRYKKAKDDNNAQIVKLRTEKEDAYGRLAKMRTERDNANKRIAKLTTEKDDANRRVVKLRTERDKSNSDAARLKVEKDELLNMLQKQKSRNNAGQHCGDALNKQLHEKDMECKQSKKIVENLNRKLDEIQSQQKEFLKPRDREDLKREENSNRKLIEENEELRNDVFEMEQQLAGQNREHIDTEHQYRSDIDRYRQERNRACSKLNMLQEQMKNKTTKLKEQETLYHEDRKQLENRIQDLQDQISDRLGKLSQQEQLDPVRDELSIMKIKLSSLEGELKINKDRKYVLENENEELNNKYQDVLRKLQESDSRYSSQSDFEKENESLKHELTMSLMNNEKIKQENKDLEKRHDTEMTKNKEITYRLQNDLDRLKSQQDLQKQTSRGELDSLKEQRTKLERDKQILRAKIYSLENEKIGLEERINQAELILQNQQTLREENSDLKESLESMKKEMENMEEKNKKETAIRISTDGTITKLKDENDRLQKERNKAKYDIDRISREKEELAHELQHEIDAAKEEHDNLKKDKNELTSIFQQKAKRDQEKIYQLEKGREVLVARDLESKNQRCTKCDQYERNLSKLMKEIQELQDRYKKETAIRISTDGTTTKLKDENDRLRKERNRANIDVERISREREELEHELQHEIDAAKEEHDNLKKDKNELTSIFQQKAKRDQEKIYQLEKEREALVARDLESKNQRCTKCDQYERNLSKLMKEIQELQDRYKKETAIRISTDGTTTKLKDENDRLRKERNRANIDVERISREKEELEHELQHEIDAAKLEHDNLKKDKNELTSLFQQKAKSYKEKIDQLEKECETLVARNISGEKTTQHNAYELLQLKNDYAVCKQQKALLEEDLSDQRQDITELEKRIKDLESRDQRCTKCDQYERTLTKLKKENQELQDRDLESRDQRCTKCDQYERTLAKLKKENQELQDRYNIVTTELHNTEKKILDLEEENKEQKRQNREVTGIVKKLVQEKRELENQLRSQETSAATKDSGEVITLQRRINILQSDNEDLIQKCKHKDGLQEKSDKDLRQLKTVISNLQSDIVEHKQTNDTLSNRIEILREEKLELEERMRRRSPQVVSDARNCQNCWKYRNEISDLKRDINRLRDRLSEATGNKLRENNPNIADLSNMNRPTSLADKFNSLYTDEYTDAMEVIEGSMDEAGAVQVMLEWLKCCYNWCERLAREQRDLLTTQSIGFMNKYQGQKINYVVSDNCLIHVKEFQKKIAVDTLTAVRKICHVKSVTQENLIHDNYIVKYIQRCSELCWMMQITDPPLCLKFDVKNNEDLDKTLYNAFTKNGSKIEYLVWPIIFLHKSGPMLAKGVAQGT